MFNFHKVKVIVKVMKLMRTGTRFPSLRHQETITLVFTFKHLVIGHANSKLSSPRYLSLLTPGRAKLLEKKEATVPAGMSLLFLILELDI